MGGGGWGGGGGGGAGGGVWGGGGGGRRGGGGGRGGERMGEGEGCLDWRCERWHVYCIVCRTTETERYPPKCRSQYVCLFVSMCVHRAWLGPPFERPTPDTLSPSLSPTLPCALQHKRTHTRAHTHTHTHAHTHTHTHTRTHTHTHAPRNSLRLSCLVLFKTRTHTGWRV